MMTRAQKIAAAILAAVAAGSYVAVSRPGHVTDEERVLIEVAGGDSRVRALLEENDLRPFAPAPVFSGMPAPLGTFEAGGFDSLANFGYSSDREWEVPSELSYRRVVFNDLAAPWGEHGPKWGVRAYNVVGALSDLELWRVGDWTNGREGHAVYLNVAGSLTVRGLIGHQCGGQLLQIVWRVGETRMPREAWPDERDLISIIDCAALDCGMINQGAAVRASWPVSVFATGARVEVSGLTVDTALPPFVGDRGETFRSHGALLVTGGEEGRRTPSLVVEGLRGRVVSSDRAEVRLSAIDVAILRGVSLTETGGDDACTIALVDDCGALLIEGCTAPVRLEIVAASRPWNTPYRALTVPAGGRFEWRRGQ